MRSLALLLVMALAATGCARFDDRLDDPFTPAPGPGMGAAPPSTPPGSPPPSPTPRSGQPEPTPESGPCVDPDPAVIATCLDPAVAVAGVGQRALVAQSSGRVTIVSVDAQPEEFGRVDVRGGRVAAVALVVGLRARVLVVLIDAGDPAGVAVPAAEVTVSPGAWPTAEAAGGAMAASAAIVSMAVAAEVLRTMPARIQAR